METNLASCDLFKDNSTGEFYRVLSIDPNDRLVDLFQCHHKIDECGLNFTKSYDEVLELIHNNKFTLQDDDPFIRQPTNRNPSARAIEIAEKTKKFFDVINNYPIEDLVEPTIRWQIIKQACGESKASIMSGIKWIKKFFNGGMTESSLDPNYERCGAPGQDRNSGIPKKYRLYVTRGYKTFYLDKGFNLKDAWRATKRKYKKQFENFKLELHVFRFQGERKFSIAVTKETRLGWRDYQNNRRLSTGRANDIADGPCVVYQIDSSVRDIQLVSSYDKTQFIGKATFYVVSDVWSRAIISVYITLDNPSYIAAANALFLAFSDRTSLYERVGLDLKYFRFKKRSIPREIVADRAELLSPKANVLLKEIGVKAIGNTKRYSPKQKGNVEKLIDLIQKRVKSNFLGKGQVLKDDGKRLATNTRKEACITLNQLIKITLITVDEYNNDHPIISYVLTSEMVKDKVNKIPAEMYEWGIKNKVGTEKHKDQKTLWYNLLEREEKKPIKTGVVLNGQTYTPISDADRDILQNIFLKAKKEKVTLAYDPRSYKNVCWLFQGRIIPLRLLGKDDAQYDNPWELIGSNSYYSEQDRFLQGREEDIREQNDNEVEKILNEGTQNSSKKKGKNKVKTKGSRAAKRFENEMNRQSATTVAPEEVSTSKNKSTKLKSKWLNNLKKANR